MDITTKDYDNLKRKCVLKDPASAITHWIGAILAALGVMPLLMKAASKGSPTYVVSMWIFIFTMIILYSASATYHAVDSTETINRRLRKMDHMMIFFMIAGGYTPIFLVVLDNPLGYILCGIMWTLVACGIVLKGCWITCPKWFSSFIYIGMGWVGIPAFAQIDHLMPRVGFFWFLAGGIIYTIGGLIYALKLPLFDSKHKIFGSHEIFHVFIMFGSVCHYIMMYCYVL